LACHLHVAFQSFESLCGMALAQVNVEPFNFVNANLLGGFYLGYTFLFLFDFLRFFEFSDLLVVDLDFLFVSDDLFLFFVNLFLFYALVEIN
jgi:uncharacterized membrane protein YesL